jgi:hypothetical protein
MKKLKSFLIICIGILLLAVQPIKAQSANAYLQENEWYKSFTAIVATDTTYSTAEVAKTFFVNKTDGYKYIYQCAGTRRNTVGDATFTLYGSIDGVKFYTIEAKTWRTSTADTVLYFTTASNVAWRYLKGGMKGTATGTKLTLGAQKLALFK